MERIPILKMGPYLLVTIQVDMHDRVAMTLQDELTERIVSDRAQGVLLDISSVDVVDSFIGRMIGNIAAMSRVLDAETVVVIGKSLGSAAAPLWFSVRFLRAPGMRKSRSIRMATSISWWQRTPLGWGSISISTMWLSPALG